MSSLRTLVLRGMFGISLLIAVLATHMAVGKAKLPFVLLDSIDKAMSRVDRQVEELEARTPALPDLEPWFAQATAHLDVANDAASERLDLLLATVADLTPERRLAALEVTFRHLIDARAALVQAKDPAEFAEYDALCERLRDVRRILA